MKYNKLSTSKDKLILFFNGWAMNESIIKHLSLSDYDVIEVNDYRNFDFNFNELNLKKYKEKNLICFSMGVYCANLFYDQLSCFDKKIAINGTTKIINDNFGIPTKIYRITEKFLNEENLEKFIDNMFNKTNINFKNNIVINRNIAELKQELISIQNIKLEKELEFDKTIISDNDKIIPSKNQIDFWENYKENTYNKIEIKKINSTHCPFNLYNNWQDLLCMIKN